MKTALVVVMTVSAAFAQEDFNFKLLDKLGVHAKESTNITLDGDTLKAAGNLLGGDKDAAGSTPKSLKSIYVRSFKFAESGQYDPADLVPLRTYLDKQKWKKIVDTKSSTESTEISLQTRPNDRVSGLAIVSAKPEEVTVVFISGDMSMNDLSKLSGNMGLPDIQITHTDKKPDAAK
jgi:hypothetical protein